jgi:hypothetical protein
MKSVEREVKKSMNQMGNPEITPLPNGIKIRIGPAMPQKRAPQKQHAQKSISEEQILRMSRLPRTTAKTKNNKPQNRKKRQVKKWINFHRK